MPQPCPRRENGAGNNRAVVAAASHSKRRAIPRSACRRTAAQPFVVHPHPPGTPSPVRRRTFRVPAKQGEEQVSSVRQT